MCVLTVNFQTLIICFAVIGGIIIIAFLVCLFCCCKCEDCGWVCAVIGPTLESKINCLVFLVFFFVHIVPGYGYFRLLACSPFLKPALVRAAAVYIQNHSMYFPRSYLISPTLVLCWRTKRFEAKMQRQSNKLKTKQEERWEVIWVSYTLCWKLLEIWKTKTKSPVTSEATWQVSSWGNAPLPTSVLHAYVLLSL